MPLTLTQFLLLVITIAVVIAITFLVSLMVQLRKTARQGEETLIEIRELTKNLKLTDQKVNSKIDEFGELISASKKTAVNLSEATWLVTSKIFKPTSKYWPILFPLLRFGWRRLKKKRKEAKNGK
jgi:hypothetical protein